MERASRAGSGESAAVSDRELLTLLETLYESRNPTRRWLHRTRRDWIIGKIRECAQTRPGRALEIGFGAGVYLPALCEAYREVTATEMSEAHLEHARQLASRYRNLRLAADNVLESKLPEASFDLVLCSEVIEHIADTAGVLGAIRRCIAEGGFLILSTPQRNSVLELACKVAFMPGVINVVRRIYGEVVFETGHINLMTEDEMTAAIAAAGFRVREQFKSGMYLPLVAEFGGETGLRIEKRLEARLRRGALGWMLWTQYYVAQA